MPQPSGAARNQVRLPAAVPRGTPHPPHSPRPPAPNGARPESAQRETATPGQAGDRLPQHRQEQPMRLASQGQERGTCPSCRHDGLHVMGFQLKNGDTAQMRRCARCEWKSWWLGERQVALAELLATVQETGLPRASRKRSSS